MASPNKFLNNLYLASGTKGNLGDFQHAARLYNDANFRLAPKTKFLYYVVFNINPAALSEDPEFKEKHITEINLLVKNVQLPKFTVDITKEKQYNRNKIIQKKITYDDISLDFHDDMSGVTTRLWKIYYQWYFFDHRHNNNKDNNPNSGVPPQYDRKVKRLAADERIFRYGLDPKKGLNHLDIDGQFFDSIHIYQLYQQKYTQITLVNPMVKSWQHDQMDYSLSEVTRSSMTLSYETVFYNVGDVEEDNPRGFATTHYDKIPSPLSLPGGNPLGPAGGSSGNGFGGPKSKGIQSPISNNILGNTKSGTGPIPGLDLKSGTLGVNNVASLGGMNNYNFPKVGGKGGNFDVTKAVPALTNVAKMPQMNSTQMYKTYNSNDNSLGRLASATTYRAQTRGQPFGGNVNVLNQRWGNLPGNEQQIFKNIALTALRNADPFVKTIATAALNTITNTRKTTNRYANPVTNRPVTGIGGVNLTLFGGDVAAANGRYAQTGFVRDEATGLNRNQANQIFNRGGEVLANPNQNYARPSAYSSFEKLDLNEDGFANDFGGE